MSRRPSLQQLALYDYSAHYSHRPTLAVSRSCETNVHANLRAIKDGFAIQISVLACGSRSGDLSCVTCRSSLLRRLDCSAFLYSLRLDYAARLYIAGRRSIRDSLSASCLPLRLSDIKISPGKFRNRFGRSPCPARGDHT